MAASLLCVEGALPDRILTNAELGEQNPDWDMEKLYAKTGIRQRRIAAEGQTAVDLADAACRKVLDRAMVPADAIDYLIFCTQSPDYYLPSGACLLQDRLKLRKSVGALDVNLGCSAYVYGLQLAQGLINTGQARNVLLATADTYSKYIHPRDRTLRVLFGDAGAATLVGDRGREGGIGPFVVGTDGSGWKNLIVPAGGLREPRSERTGAPYTDAAGCTRSRDHLFMDGAAIFAFSLRVVPALIREVLQKAGLTHDDVDWFVYHQANKFMLEQLAVRSAIPPQKVMRYHEDVGNTVSSSIPLTLWAYATQGRIRPGQKLALLGFGVGYSWAGCLVQWDQRDSDG